MKQEPDYQWINRDLKDQLLGAIETLNKLRDRVLSMKATLVHHVDQGEGLTHEELVELYAEIERLFPRRVRSAPKSLDAPL